MEQTTVQKGRRPQARSLDTRAAILAAAEQIFAKAGLDGARTDAIAAAAGVNKALLYYYFKSKDGLYEAVSRTTSASSTARRWRCSPRPAPPRDRPAALRQPVLRLHQRPPPLRRRSTSS